MRPYQEHKDDTLEQRGKVADNLLRMSKQGIKLVMGVITGRLLSMRITQESLFREYDKEKESPIHPSH